MVVKKEQLLLGFIIVAGLAAGGAAFNKYNQIKAQKIASQEKIATLKQTAESSREAMTKAYEERWKLIEPYLKSKELAKDASIPVLKVQVDQSLKLPLKTEQELEKFDLSQNQLNEKIATLMQNPSFKTQALPELQKIEVQIMLSRKAYHETSFEMNDLIEKNKLKETPQPVFAAEKMLREINH